MFHLQPRSFGNGVVIIFNVQRAFSPCTFSQKLVSVLFSHMLYYLLTILGRCRNQWMCQLSGFDALKMTFWSVWSSPAVCCVHAVFTLLCSTSLTSFTQWLITPYPSVSSFIEQSRCCKLECMLVNHTSNNPQDVLRKFSNASCRTMTPFSVCMRLQLTCKMTEHVIVSVFV